jgi:hypothetical protein
LVLVGIDPHANAAEYGHDDNRQKKAGLDCHADCHRKLPSVRYSASIE